MDLQSLLNNYKQNRAGLDTIRKDAFTDYQDTASNATTIADNIRTAILDRNNNLQGVIMPASEATSQALNFRDKFIAENKDAYTNPFNLLKALSVGAQPVIAGADALARIRDLVAGDINTQTQYGVGVLDNTLKAKAGVLDEIERQNQNLLRDLELNKNFSDTNFNRNLTLRQQQMQEDSYNRALQAEAEKKTQFQDLLKQAQGLRDQVLGTNTPTPAPVTPETAPVPTPIPNPGDAGTGDAVRAHNAQDLQALRENINIIKNEYYNEDRWKDKPEERDLWFKLQTELLREDAAKLKVQLPNSTDVNDLFVKALDQLEAIDIPQPTPQSGGNINVPVPVPTPPQTNNENLSQLDALLGQLVTSLRTPTATPTASPVANNTTLGTSTTTSLGDIANMTNQTTTGGVQNDLNTITALLEKAQTGDAKLNQYQTLINQGQEQALNLAVNSGFDPQVTKIAELLYSPEQLLGADYEDYTKRKTVQDSQLGTLETLRNQLVTTLIGSSLSPEAQNILDPGRAKALTEYSEKQQAELSKRADKYVELLKSNRKANPNAMVTLTNGEQIKVGDLFDANGNPKNIDTYNMIRIPLN